MNTMTVAPLLLAWLLTGGGVPPRHVPSAGDGSHRATAQPAGAPRAVPLQPDYTLIALPTTRPVGRGRSAFRVTHRFARPLGAGDFGDLAGDLFGLDAGALIGLEYRIGLAAPAQVGVHRTSDKILQLFGQYELLRQGEGVPVGLAVHGSVEGLDNFSERYSPSIGALISREFGAAAAVYVEPFWIGNSNAFDAIEGEENDTFLVGLGVRLRVRPTVYVVAETAPRLSGFDPGVHQVSVGVEKRAGGHLFQLNVSNGFGTTPGQMARGGPERAGGGQDWYLGFNISRKFGGRR